MENVLGKFRKFGPKTQLIEASQDCRREFQSQALEQFLPECTSGAFALHLGFLGYTTLLALWSIFVSSALLKCIIRVCTAVVVFYSLCLFCIVSSLLVYLDKVFDYFLVLNK